MLFPEQTNVTPAPSTMLLVVFPLKLPKEMVTPALIVVVDAMPPRNWKGCPPVFMSLAMVGYTPSPTVVYPVRQFPKVNVPYPSRRPGIDTTPEKLPPFHTMSWDVPVKVMAADPAELKFEHCGAVADGRATPRADPELASKMTLSFWVGSEMPLLAPPDVDDQPSIWIQLVSPGRA
jgi:hypothetical protein